MSPTALPQNDRAPPPARGLPPVGGLPPDLISARSAILARNWWLIALRGACAVLFGILTFVMPGLSLVTLVFLFAAYLLIDGIAAIVSAIRAAQKYERWGLLVLEGAVDILAGLAAALAPGITVLVFVYLIAVWSIVSGAFMAVAAFQLHLDHGRWLMVLAGVASVIFGGLLAFAPIAGAVVLAFWLGAYALVFGIMLVVLAFRLRSRAPTSSTGV